MSTKVSGDLGEQEAKQFLKAQNYKIITSNFRSMFGEIDIIALDGRVLVFVEVKKRTNSKYGNPEEAVTPKKIKRIYKTIDYFLLKNSGYKNFQKRLDVIAISKGGNSTSVKHIKNAGS